jgi:hypothetical protein
VPAIENISVDAEPQGAAIAIGAIPLGGWSAPNSVQLRVFLPESHPFGVTLLQLDGGLLIQRQSDGRVSFNHPAGGTGISDISYYGWVLVSVVWDGVDVALYVDAAWANVMPGGARPSPERPMRETPSQYMASSHFEELRVWSRALRSAEIVSTLVECDAPQESLVACIDLTRIPPHDRSGNDIEATLVGGATYCRATTAGRFDVGSGIVLCGSDHDWTCAGDGPMTVEAWVRPDWADAGVIAGTWQWGGFTIQSWTLTSDESGRLTAARGPNDGVMLTISAPSALPLKAWAHVAFVYEPDRHFDSYRLFVDGKQVAHQAASSFSLPNPLDELSIGGAVMQSMRPPPTPIAQFSGAIEQVRIWRSARSAEELIANMHDNPFDDPDIVGFYWSDFGRWADASGRHGWPMLVGGVAVTGIADCFGPDGTASARPRAAAPFAPRVVASEQRPPPDRRRRAPGHAHTAAPAMLLAIEMFVAPVGLSVVPSPGGSLLVARLLETRNVDEVLDKLVTKGPTEEGLRSLVSELHWSGQLGGVLMSTAQASARVASRLTATFYELFQTTRFTVMLRKAIDALSTAWDATVAGMTSASSMELTIDVFQALYGDSVLVSSSYRGADSAPKPFSILFDGGPSRSNFRAVVGPSLPRSLDVLCATHSDADHVVGLQELMAGVSRQPPAGADEQVVKSAWINPPAYAVDPTHPEYRAAFRDDGSVDAELRLLGADDPRFTIRSWNQLWNLAEELIAKNVPHENPDSQSPAKVINDLLKAVFRGPYPWNVEKWEAGGPNGGPELSNRASIMVQFVTPRAPIPALLMAADAFDQDEPDSGPGVPAGYKRTDIRLNPPNNPPAPPLHYTFMKVPHHGSEDTDDSMFYTCCLAGYYLISANGRHDHPRLTTLLNIVKSNVAAGRTDFSIYVTNRTAAVDSLSSDPTYGPQAVGYNLFVLAPPGTASVNPGATRLRFRGIETSDTPFRVVATPVPGVEVLRLPPVVHDDQLQSSSNAPTPSLATD